MDKHAEVEVEKLLAYMLPGTPFEGKVKAVGGYVRDELIASLKGDEFLAKDLDIVVDEKGGAEALARYIHKVRKGSTSEARCMGKGYPIWQVTFTGNIDISGGPFFETKGAVVEFADTMKETFPDAESRQREVEYASLDEDVKRRDFTVNMLLKDMTTGLVEDHTGVSVADLKSGILRAHPSVEGGKMFSEDPLRLLRMVRFSVCLGLTPTVNLKKSALLHAYRIKIVSAERIQAELSKILYRGKLAEAIVLMKEVGLLEHVFPEVAAMDGVEQNPVHHSEGCVLTHTLMVLGKAKPGAVHQLSALLHDVGKPKAKVINDGNIQFPAHDYIGAKMAKEILERMKYPKETIRRVVHAVDSHMRPFNLSDPKVTNKALRKFIRDMGDDMGDVINLTLADSQGRLPYRDSTRKLVGKLNQVRKKDAKALEELGRKPLVSGKDVMVALGITAGPDVGRAIALSHEVIDEELEKGITPAKEVVLGKVQVLFNKERDNDAK